jgi:hypothetical protein
MDLLPFRKNLSFFAIDMDRLALDDPELTADVARAVGEAMVAGHYKRVPVMRFPMGKVKEAMELMKSGRHVGKVCSAVLKPSNVFLPRKLNRILPGACRSCWSTRTRRATSTSFPSFSLSRSSDPT